MVGIVGSYEETNRSSARRSQLARNGLRFQPEGGQRVTMEVPVGTRSMGMAFKNG